FRVLCNYLHLLKDWRTEYAPKSAEEQPNPLFVKALTETDYIESLLDYFISGTKDDIADIVKDENGSIAKIEKIVRQFSKPSTELTM
ncbi:MAG: DNA primase, partial [Oscillospiraceae bacterium]|nr:DNA primase [Oscillospiraceae bacterium]